MKIGVFDSGIGGLSVANALRLALPNDEIIFKNDNLHVPYGTKTSTQLLEWVPPILNELVLSGCELIVIACNSVSTTIIDELKHQTPVTLIPMVPMVREACALTQSGIIAICATPVTLASQRYEQLKHQYAIDIKVLEPNCGEWALMIENNAVDQIKIKTTIDEVCNDGADIIVFGCTHYHWIEDLIRSIAQNRATILQPEQTIINQVKQVLVQLA